MRRRARAEQISLLRWIMSLILGKGSRPAQGASGRLQAPGVDLPGRETALVTWMTPFDCITSAWVTVAVPPRASVRTIERPPHPAVSTPPCTVVSRAVPRPARIARIRSAAVIRPATT